MNNPLLEPARQVIDAWETGDLAEAVRELDCAIADVESAPPHRRATIARLFMLAYTRVAGKHGTALTVYLGKALALMALPHQADGVELEVRNLLNTAKAIFRMAKLNRDILPRR